MHRYLMACTKDLDVTGPQKQGMVFHEITVPLDVRIGVCWFFHPETSYLTCFGLELSWILGDLHRKGIHLCILCVRLIYMV